MVTEKQVADVLTPMLGAKLVARAELGHRMSAVLNAWPQHSDLEQLAQALADAAFDGLNLALGRRMTYLDERGGIRRIYLSALPELADEALFPLLSTLDEAACPSTALRDYAVRTGSTAAMRALLGREGVLSPADRTTMERIVRESAISRQNGEWMQ